MRTTETYTLPAHWASYLLNGDASGISDADEHAVNAWLDAHKLGTPVSCSDESWFANS